MRHTLILPRTHLLAALTCAGTDDTRAYLNAVHVEAHTDRVFLVASDGRRMGVLRCSGAPAGAAPTSTPVSFTIPRALLAHLKPNKRASDPAMIVVIYDSATQALEIRDPVTDNVITGGAIDQKYPPWRRVVPTHTDGQAAQFDPEYIADFARVARLLGARHFPGVHIHHNGPGAALVQIAGHLEFLGALMPMRPHIDGRPDPAAVRAFIAEPAPATTPA